MHITNCVCGALEGQQGQYSGEQAQEFEDIFAQFFGGGGGGFARGGMAGGFGGGGGFGGFRAKGPDIHARIRCAVLLDARANRGLSARWC